MKQENNEMSKEELYSKAVEIFNNKENRKILAQIGIKSVDDIMERCKILPDHLAERNEETYGENSRLYKYFQRDPNLREILVIFGIEGGNYIAEYFGTNKASIPGHIANERIGGEHDGKIELDENVKTKLREKIDKEFKDTITDQKKDEICNNVTIDDLELIAEEGGLNNIRDKILKDENSKNHVSDKSEKNVPELNSEDREICKMLGIPEEQVIDTMTVRATELVRKTDGFSLVENQISEKKGYVKLIEVKSEKASGPNRYYGIQNGQIVLYGFQEVNEDIGRIFDGDTQKYNGGLITTPLRADNDKEYIEISTGKETVQLDINDNSELCTHEIDDYRDLMQKLLTDYSQEMHDAEQNGVSKEELDEITKQYKIKAKEIAKDCDINKEDAEAELDEAESTLNLPDADDGEEIEDDGVDPRDTKNGGKIF